MRLTMPDHCPTLQSAFNMVRDFAYEKRLAQWEAWSLSRWWFLFSGLTGWIALKQPPGEQRETVWRRLLWFSPWLAVLELGFLGGAWLGFGGFRVVPEPSTIFAGFFAIRHWLDPHFLLFWFVRAAIPMLIVGTVYFRLVPQWRWRSAVLGGIALIPCGMAVSILWSSFYMLLLQFKIVD